jgi:glycosyltransferase involved in cell wall biosynthesis
MEKKKCIFHVPNYIDTSGKSGSQVRPIKMREALENIGYDVEIISGYGIERKKKIEKIKQRVKAGVKYEFLYSESSTMPTLLTEKKHLPKYPNLDFDFFKFCKKNAIPIGLFYRDVFWKFEQYRNAVPWYYKIVTYPFYKYDLFKYNQLVDILYLPSKEIARYVPECKKIKQKVLLPGASYNQDNVNKRIKYYQKREMSTINIFYVGGVSGIYDILDFVKIVRDYSYVKLTICCKKEMWETERERYKPFLTDRITIVHKSGEELIPYYHEADICACYFDVEKHKYMKIATPIKLFEYISYLTPIISTKGGCAGDFVQQYNIGWSIPYREEAIRELLEYLHNEPNEIILKQKNIFACLEKNTWEDRALQLEKDLRRIKNERTVIKEN